MRAGSFPGGGSGSGATPTPTAPGLTVFLASSDLYAGAPQRVDVGLVAADGRLVSFGEVAYAFTYTGTSSNPMDPVPGPTATATYLEHKIFGALIVFFLIVEPHGLARLWATARQKLRMWPFPH